MKSHRLKIAVLLAAVVSLLLYGALPAFASVPDAPTGVKASASQASAMVGWIIPANNGGSAITGYTVTPTPACGGCTGLTVSGATASSTTVAGLTDGTPYTFTVHATNVNGNSVESGASSAVTPTNNPGGCNFNSFPAVPSSSSELSVNCILTTAVGSAGNDYRIEDYPQASWSQGAGRSVTTTAATAKTSAVITASAAHFSAQDVNDTVTGTGVPKNAFIKSVTATTATLDVVTGGAGIAKGAKLIVSNSDGRTITDGIFPATTVAAASNGVNVSTFTGTQTLSVAAITHFATLGGQVQVATSDPGGAILSYTTAAGTNLTHVNLVSGSGTLATGGRVSNTSSIYSTTAHFCKVGLAGCNSGATQKNDVGRVLSATLIQHGTTITAVNSATSANISLPWLTTGCPTGVPAANSAQVGLSSSPTTTNSRQIKDALYTSGTTKVCSASAGFAQTDVNLPIANVGAGRIPANDYITAVAGNCATIHAVWAGTNANTNVVIGSRSVSAPVNGDAVMSLSSELSVHPSEAAGEPSCSFNSAVGSNLVGKWLNPGSFDVGSLGQPSAPGVNGPMLAQLDVTTGTGTPAFAGYVVAEKASVAGESDAAAHVDIVFPSLLTGIAVCPEPNDVGVATSFRFFGETLTQSAAGNGNVRSFNDLPAGSPPVSGSAYEHIIKNAGSVTLVTASGNCTDAYPTTSAGYSCGGQ